jgi:hypothetical protein
VTDIHKRGKYTISLADDPEPGCPYFMLSIRDDAGNSVDLFVDMDCPEGETADEWNYAPGEILNH